MVAEIMIDIGNMFYSLFGDGLLLALIVLGFFTILLVVLRVPIAGILMVILPMIIGFTLNFASTNFIYIPPWVLMGIIIFMGLIFAGFFLWFIR